MPLLGPKAKFWASVGVAALLLEAAVRLNILSPASYAAPTEVLIRLCTMITQDSLLKDALHTATRAVVGTVIGLSVGFLCALGLYLLNGARSSGELLLDFLRSVPLTALVPVFIAVYGIGESSRIAIGAAAAALGTAITIWVGIKETLTQFATLKLLYRPAKAKELRHIVLPTMAPSLATAVRIASSSALVLIIVAEMFIGSASGIGYVINAKTYGDDRPGQYAAVLIAGLLGYLMSNTAELLRRRIAGAFVPMDN